MSKSLTDSERLDSATAATLAAQQRAFDSMLARLKAIEEKATKQQPPPSQQ
jgi:hypothetical protein